MFAVAKGTASQPTPAAAAQPARWTAVNACGCIADEGRNVVVAERGSRCDGREPGRAPRTGVRRASRGLQPRSAPGTRRSGTAVMKSRSARRDPTVSRAVKLAVLVAAVALAVAAVVACLCLAQTSSGRSSDVWFHHPADCLGSQDYSDWLSLGLAAGERVCPKATVSFRPCPSKCPEVRLRSGRPRRRHCSDRTRPREVGRSINAQHLDSIGTGPRGFMSEYCGNG